MESTGKLTWIKGASLLTIKRDNPERVRKIQKTRLGKRQRVKEFSASSRARLKAVTSSIRREAMASASIVTLTYPASFPAPSDHATYKGHLNAFGVAMRRQFPACSFIWKLEFQRRGAAHYHLLLFGVSNDRARDFIRSTWYRIAHGGDKNKGVAGTQCDPIISPTGAACYLTTYLGKADQTMPGNFSGRYWGIIGRAELPIGDKMALDVPDDIAVKILRLAKRKMKADVEKSRWKAYLGGERAGYSRADIQRLRDAKATRKGLTILRAIPGTTGFSPCQVSTRLFKGVRPYRPKNNDSVRLVCNPQPFLRAVLQMEVPECPF